MDKEQQEYLSVGHSLNAEESQMFGKPCFKIRGKAFISYFSKSMVFKLQGETHTKALILEGAHLFDPSGKNRPMKEWVQVPYEHKDNWPNFAQKAMEYSLRTTNQ